MKKIITIFILLIAFKASAQNYDHILNYVFNGTPTNGVKIKTNIPFTPTTQMPTVIIEGNNFGTTETIGLIINWYTYSSANDFYNDPSGFYFYNATVSSFGSFTPNIYLASENGKVIIYIDRKDYYQRFTVRAYSQGMGEQPGWFQGWTTADEPNNGVKSILVPYKNRFSGDILLSGNGIWNSSGSVGIGTTTPNAKLAVNGNIRAKEVKVENANWPDYVFKKNYDLPSLKFTEQLIKEKGHLPGIPSAADVKANGVDLGEMNAKLLQKIEELTLYLIEIKKEVETLKRDKK